MKTTLFLLVAYAFACVSAASIQAQSRRSAFGTFLEARQLPGSTGSGTGSTGSTGGTNNTSACQAACAPLISDVTRCDVTDTKDSNNCFCTSTTRSDIIQCAQCQLQNNLAPLSKLQSEADDVVSRCATTNNKMSSINLSGSNSSGMSLKFGDHMLTPWMGVLWALCIWLF